ncbi:Pyridoxamine 5'-phosphate oxidase-like FMN-binding protein [Candidatus Methylobacter favarea]|uniref:Pyridoxamine 5'-phosphate oxidase-like FMN-binding protein n=1 Tax=Candidatus Methylobacter favarea TaxID=2707345 RepID=A0A8S0WKJ3_9GAMM|nr:pyridoxamine 5'-phosphate oxidase family protein [Candidatus Methylobacter favarea]CAA9892020.1 Pyridoxamine 5'-phosphate oxidase-like FMN-binding protein [Candidatus Methylobacter favarea]
MSEIYGDQHFAMQDVFDTRNMAQRVDESIVLAEISDEHKDFIQSRDMFFLTTIDHRGFPTCSYKGGKPGFVKIVDSKTIAFPSYDGNGMYLSLGNITANNKVGLLFIDFETPHRMRVHGTASIDRIDPLTSDFHGAELIVRVKVTEIFVNCPRYIHKYQRMKTSTYVPEAGLQPPPPQWKRIDALQDALPERDKSIAELLGGTITPEQYSLMVRKGEA